MSRSSCMTLLALSFAVLCYITHRDISANMFLASVFIIQGLKSPSGEPSHHWDRIYLLCALLSAAILVFSAASVLSGMQWDKPQPW